MNQNDPESMSNAGNLPAEQPKNVGGSGGQATPGLNMTNAPHRAPQPKRSKKVLAIVAAVVVVIIIAAAVLLMGMGSNSNTSAVAQIHNGSYLDYNGTGTMGTQTIAGSMTISFSNRTSTGYTLNESITINGQTTSMSQIVNESSQSWIDVSSGTTVSGVVQHTFVGIETLQTSFGQNTANHYFENFTGYRYDFWEDSSTQILLQLKFTYDNGAIFTFKLASTNMM